jgi:hypothetical protein
LQLAKNRFNGIAGSLGEAPHAMVFTGSKSNDQILIVLTNKKKMQLHSLNGKLALEIQSNLHHQLSVIQAASCKSKQLAMTLSQDCCCLWST